MSSDWPSVPIADVCTSIVDCVNKTAPSVDYPTPFKMIRTTNVRDGYIDVQNVKHVAAETYEKWTRRQVPQRGDIILTREAPLGEVGLLRSDDQVFLGQRTVAYRVDPTKAVSEFVLYGMMGPYTQNQIKAFGSGSTVEHMRVPDCGKFELKLPPLPIQKRIAAILSAYDDLIEVNTRRIAILEEMARRIYEEWANTATEVAPLSSLAELHGKSINPQKFPGEMFDHFSFPAFDQRELPEPTSGEDLKSNKTLLTERVVLVAKLNPRIPRVWAVTEISTLRRSIGSTEFVPLRPRDDLQLGLLVETIRSERFRNQVLGMSSGTSTSHQRVKPKDLLELPIPLATPDRLASLSKRLAPLQEMRATLRRLNANLRAQRDLLLPRLVSGKLDVSALDAAEEELADA